MNRNRILYTSTEVRKRIIELFASSKGRRVAITAFVGKGAEAYLPKPDGLELVCWPKAGGTNPHILRKLIKRGVQVSFVDSLHMKVYWTADKGAIVTSANLSTNALGAGNLQEFGIFIPVGQIDIDKILSSLKQRQASPQELLRLDRLHHEYEVQTVSHQTRTQGTTFPEWYKLPFRPVWKLGWWDTYSVACSVAKQVTREEYGISAPYDFLTCRRNDYKKNDWVLSFRLKGKSPTAIRWMPVDRVVPIPKSDRKAYTSQYPYQAIQVWSLTHYPAPPFRIDQRFRLAFSKAIRELGAESIRESDPSKPSKWLIDFIYSSY